ncbi:MAG TPA: hypothetical protein IAC31_06130 [Candidatus Faecousia intestinigallinarum]|nr:hypothetical protein [Candidatus Faecousia intestinigallinarum]
MKLSRKILSLAICVALLLSLSVVAFAMISKTFFIREADSHQCIGRGSIDGNVARAVLTATALPNRPVQPGEAYRSKVMLAVRDKNGNFIGTTSREGGTYANTTHEAPGSIGSIGCTFEFSGVDLGLYILYNN